MELIAMIAVGCAAHGLAMTWYNIAYPFSPLPSIPTASIVRWTIWRVGPFLSGVVVVGGIGTWLERARGKSPQSWGLGHWAWSICGACVALWSLWAVAIRVGLALRYPDWAGPGPLDLDNHLGVSLYNIWGQQSLWFLLAFPITWRLARRPPAVIPDEREWLGRVVLVLACAVSFLINFERLLRF